MAKKMTREQIELIVNRFAKQATRKHGDYAFTAGYLQSMATSLIAKLPAAEQEAQIKILLTSSVWE